MGERAYERGIRATPEQVWAALTDPGLTERYFFGTRVESTWSKDSPIAYRNADGGVDADGTIVEIERGRRLKTTFRPAWAPGLADERPGTVTWDVRPTTEGGVVLRLEHAGFDFDGPGGPQVDRGWHMTLDGLQELLEDRPPAAPAHEG